MSNILFTSMLCMATAGFFENAPLGWKVVICILFLVTEIKLLYEEYLQEKLQDRVKTLEKKLKELVGEDNESKN